MKCLHLNDILGAKLNIAAPWSHIGPLEYNLAPGNNHNKKLGCRPMEKAPNITVIGPDDAIKEYLIY